MKALASLLALSPSRAAPTHTRQAAFADNDGVKIAFEVQGRGAPILLLPGFSQSREAWKQAGFVEPLLAAGRQVILVDPRGHGASDKPHAPEAYRDEALAGDLVAVLDALGIRQADLLGYSRGGAIAIAAAIRHPDRVRSIAIGGDHPYAQDLAFYRQAVANGLGEWIAIIEANAGPMPPPARAMFLANDAAALRAAVAEDRPDRSAALAASGVPFFLYAGTDDPVCADAQLYADAAGASFLPLPGLNHMQAFFAAAPVVAAILGRDHEPPARDAARAPAAPSAT